jgi:Domain of unknown function (DUF1840)
MLYKFRSKSASDVIMMGPAGDQLLGLIGRSPSAQGIIEVAAMPAAVQALEAAVLAEEKRAEQNADATDTHEGEGDAPGADAVGLRRRVWPLLEMLRRSHADGHDVTWGV